MSARSSPKSSAKKKAGNKNAGNTPNSSKKINKNSRTNSVQEGEVVVELKSGQFYAQATAENTSENVRPQPLKVYINVDDMREMRLSGGDFVLVKRVVEEKLTETGVAEAALGIAWPMQSILSSNCQMASVLLLNCGAATGDIIVVERADMPIVHAKSIAAQLLNESDAHLLTDPSFELYIKEVLIDLEYFRGTGQIVITDYYGREIMLEIELSSEGTIDDSIARITRNSKVSFRKKEKAPSSEYTQTKSVSLNSIGGLESQITAIKEMIELPLFYPERFTTLNLSPPKGLLLFGPAGTGKTLIARAVAAEAGAHVVVVNASDIIGEFVGDTEKRLKIIFDEANAKQPSIIFIDEIDALCPSRDDNASDSEKRVVACLLTLMDGADQHNENRPRVVVIGATNRPNSIDAALRRPGRFDREFEIGIPSAQARFEILQVLLQSVKHTLSIEEIRLLSDKAHGYVGADLAAICREAGIHAIKRVRNASVNVKGRNDAFVASAPSLLIGFDDMLSGMALVKPSVIREISLQVPKVYWSEIGGQHEIKQKLKEAVEWPLKHPKVFTRFNIKPPKGLLLYGPPGCSKTLMAKALATEAGLNFLAVKGPELFSKWVGESEKAVQQIFKKARAAAPSIIFFDEIDSLAVKRSGDSAVADRVLSQLLMEMDGIEALVNVTIIAATNRPDILDSALLRPGRIDSILYVSPPDLESRKSIFTIQLTRIPSSQDVDPDSLAALTDGFSGAEVVAVCQNAASAAMMESLEASVVEKRHFLEAIRNTSPRITPEMLAFYSDFQKRSGLASV